MYTERPSGKVDDMGAMAFCLDRLPYSDAEKGPSLKVYVPTGKICVAAGRKIFTDFENVLQGIATFFHASPLPPLTQRIFLFKGEQGVITASWNGKETQTSKFSTFEEFFKNGNTASSSATRTAWPPRPRSCSPSRPSPRASSSTKFK